MKTFVIGDVHGCFDSLTRLLEKLPDRKRTIFIGDIVNRGPRSLETIRAVMRMPHTECLLGNHELHLLAVYAGKRSLARSDTLDPILEAPDVGEIIDWLRHRPLALWEKDFLCVHASCHTDWTVEDTLKYAKKVEKFLLSDHWKDKIGEIFGKNQWNRDLKGTQKLQAIVNVLTRCRYLRANGDMDFSQKLEPTETPKEFIPWFRYPGRKTADNRVTFGHWSTLGEINYPNIYPTDTACLWGGSLTALRLKKDPEWISVKAPLYRDPKEPV